MNLRNPQENFSYLESCEYKKKLSITNWSDFFKKMLNLRKEGREEEDKKKDTNGFRDRSWARESVRSRRETGREKIPFSKPKCINERIARSKMKLRNKPIAIFKSCSSYVMFRCSFTSFWFKVAGVDGFKWAGGLLGGGGGGWTMELILVEVFHANSSINTT